MPDVEEFQLLIMGGGKAGKTLAMDMARTGLRVALVEREYIGGSCINVACIPTKALVRSAEVAELVRSRANYGMRAGETAVDMPTVAARTAGIVAGMVEDHRRLFAESGLELILGEGRFAAPRVIEVQTLGAGTRRLTADRIFLNLGTRAAIPPIPGLRDVAPLTHVEALRLERVPEHLVVLGGGYVGMEMAQAFRRLGSEVTLIERGPQLAAREDPDLADAVLTLLRGEGISVHLNTAVAAAVGRSGERVSLRLTTAGGETTLEGSDLLVAVGRAPQTAGIGLEKTGIRTNAAGYIEVDEHLATTAPGIWALGEAAGSPMFTHVALDDYRVARSLIRGEGRTTRGRLVPYAVFIEPELGRIGLNETQAQKQSIAVRVATLPMNVVPRARALSETRGFMKAVVAVGSDEILGFSMLGAHAGEVVAVVQTAMWGKLPYTAFRDGIIAHPTMAEGLNLLFAKIPTPAGTR